jgi:TPR repeat protein
MILRHFLFSIFWFAFFSAGLHAAISLQTDSSASMPADVEGPARPAMEAFQSGRHIKAIELAKPLADQGNAEALYLLGFAHESGQGVEPSREKALEYYRKAAAGKHKDAVYRMSFILLASSDVKERDQARQALETAAKDDPEVAARILGEAYLRGLLTAKPDSEKAVFWWGRAADAGDTLSMILLARFYEGQFGFSQSKDLEKAMASYARAAGLGNSGAMAVLGSRLLSGDAKLRDERKGRDWLKKALDAGETSAHLVLGDYEEFVKKDMAAALAAYQRGSDAGQVDCMLRLADFHLQGKGVEKNEAKGNELLRKAAESGHPIANLRIAANCFSGDEPTPEKKIAGYGHLLAAANANYGQAQNELGLLYLSGKLGATDAPAGVAWLTRAAQGGNPQAQNNLAALYETGLAGLAKDLDRAIQLYSMAANQGHGPATFALARLVHEGIGTQADPVKAWVLATVASERGEKEADPLARRIIDQLDEKQRAEALRQLEEVKFGKQATAAKSDIGPEPVNPAKPPQIKK